MAVAKFENLYLQTTSSSMQCSEPVNQKAAPTGYQTLVSVNKIDQNQFKSVDTNAVTKYWSKVFIQNNVSADIHDAISGKSGQEAQATRDSVSKICLLQLSIYASLSNRYTNITTDRVDLHCLGFRCG